MGFPLVRRSSRAVCHHQVGLRSCFLSHRASTATISHGQRGLNGSCRPLRRVLQTALHALLHPALSTLNQTEPQQFSTLIRSPVVRPCSTAILPHSRRPRSVIRSRTAFRGWMKQVDVVEAEVVAAALRGQHPPTVSAWNQPEPQQSPTLHGFIPRSTRAKCRLAELDSD
jgi:hypothetical protein